MPRPRLTAAEIQSALATLPGWTCVEGKLHRDYLFPGFPQAIAFMAAAAPAIDQLDHHPEWSNVYNRVAVDLVTHDSGGVTAKDLELARILDPLAAQHS
jgi:4a-hydroxytetrahydrobiopterin dehydratase